MKKSLFIAALATLALASCSKNEVIELQQDQIKFSAVADNASRGTVVTTATLNNFYAWGWVEQDDAIANDYETLYFKDVLFEKVGANFISQTTNYWWPTGAMKFYATNLDNVELESGTFEYEVSTTLNAQKDLLYAAMFNQTKKEVVDLNFRHALSQIVFQVGVDEKGANLPLEVTIKRINLAGINNKANFTMPTANTNEPNYSEPDGGEGDINGKTEDHDTYSTSWGKWSNHSGGETYSAIVETSIRNDVFGGNPKTDGYINYGTSDNAMMLLLPQSIEGKILSVECEIKTKGANGDLITLHDNTLTALNYTFPTDSKWEQGKKYVYKLKFGASSLSTIKFNVTVDVYQTATTTPIEL